MDRRLFYKACGSLLAGAASISIGATASSSRAYPESTLADSDGIPINLDNLTVGSSHIFSYPYVTTPCFLIRLEPNDYGTASLTDSAGQTYEWKGGAGPDHSIVAFSAICTHKMSHPARPISHINFRKDEREVMINGKMKSRTQLITCCSENSIYDPAAGARVLSGPATQPLAAIAITVNDAGHIIATGSYGGDMYDQFMASFGFRLALEHGVSDVATLVGETTEVIAAESFSRQQIKC